MRVVFFAYWLWYTLMVIVCEYVILPIWGSKIVTMLMFYNLGFVIASPLFFIIYPTVLKSHRSDPVFLNLCLMAGIIRIVVWSFLIWGLRNTIVVWGINIFAMGIVAIGEKHFKKIDNQYFKH